MFPVFYYLFNKLIKKYYYTKYIILKMYKFHCHIIYISTYNKF